MHNDIILACSDGKVCAHSARLIDLSPLLLELLSDRQCCSNCKEPTVIQLPQFMTADCNALIQLIYKGETRLENTKVERVVALSRTLNIQLNNVFGDIDKELHHLRFNINFLGNPVNAKSNPVRNTPGQQKAPQTKVTPSKGNTIDDGRSSTAVKVINPVELTKNSESRKRRADAKELNTYKKAKVVEIKSEVDIVDIKTEVTSDDSPSELTGKENEFETRIKKKVDSLKVKTKSVKPASNKKQASLVLPSQTNKPAFHLVNYDVEDKIMAEIEDQLSEPTQHHQVSEVQNVKLTRCWFCDKKCKFLSVHCALFHFREQILSYTENGKCISCNKYMTEDSNELILHIAFEHLGFRTKKKSFTPEFLKSKGLVVEISDKEIKKASPVKEPTIETAKENAPNINKKSSEPKVQKSEVENMAAIKEESKTLPSDIKRKTMRQADSSDLTDKPKKSGQQVMDKLKLFKNKKMVSRRRKVILDSKRQGNVGCGNCWKCELPNCGQCAFCQDMPEFGGSGKLRKVCMKKVCRNK